MAQKSPIAFHSKIYSSFILMYGNMLEQSITVPCNLDSSTPFRIAIGLWFVIGIIFPNAYKGLAITGVTAPLPGQYAEYFENLSAFQSTCDPFYTSCAENWDNDEELDSSKDYKLLSYPLHYARYVDDRSFSPDPMDYTLRNVIMGFSKYTYLRYVRYETRLKFWTRENNVLKSISKFSSKRAMDIRRRAQQFKRVEEATGMWDFRLFHLPWGYAETRTQPGYWQISPPTFTGDQESPTFHRYHFIGTTTHRFYNIGKTCDRMGNKIVRTTHRTKIA